MKGTRRLLKGALTCQHALDRLAGQALGELELLHGHGPRELHVSVDDGRAHVARAVALHPAVLREVEAFQLDAEELHPVIAPPRSRQLTCTYTKTNFLLRCSGFGADYADHIQGTPPCHCTVTVKLSYLPSTKPDFLLQCLLVLGLDLTSQMQKTLAAFDQQAASGMDLHCSIDMRRLQGFHEVASIRSMFRALLTCCLSYFILKLPSAGNHYPES